MERKSVAYSQWLEYVRTVKDKGIKSEAMMQLCSSYPQVNMQDYKEYIYNELAKLESLLLSESMEGFQPTVNKCLSENDLELLYSAIKVLKKEVSICFFFNEIEQFSNNMKEKLTIQMVDSLKDFINEFQKYVKRIEDNGNDIFVSDFCYICQKAKLKKFVEELNIYV